MGIDLGEACGLTSDQFSKLQREIVMLRDNLIQAARAEG